MKFQDFCNMRRVEKKQFYLSSIIVYIASHAGSRKEMNDLCQKLEGGI
jgi:hypothetical protein|tara:strand:- start:224 stop:367 length:144 start_codon:yes stop_codon:yes gene_type:complete